LYVGGLPWSTTSEELRKLFIEYGTVESADVMTERESGRSKGFGFVQMATPAEAQEAISHLNGTDFGGRRLTVTVARPKEDRPPRRDGDRGGYRNRGEYGSRDGGERGGYSR